MTAFSGMSFAPQRFRHYCGGAQEVLKAYRSAKLLLSFESLSAILSKLDYIYPCHQTIGFYMQRAGYEESSWEEFKKPGFRYDFYLAHGERDVVYDAEWHLYRRRATRDFADLNTDVTSHGSTPAPGTNSFFFVFPFSSGAALRCLPSSRPSLEGAGQDQRSQRTEYLCEAAGSPGAECRLQSEQARHRPWLHHP